MRELLSKLRIPGDEDPAVRLLRSATARTCRTGIRDDCVVYTGTHDNDTTRGWYARLTPEERERVYDYLGSDGHQIEWDLIRAALTSVAARAIVPMQDVLGLSTEARMNNPAVPSGNWRWRAPADAFRPELAQRLRRVTALSGRLPSAPANASAPPPGTPTAAR